MKRFFLALVLLMGVCISGYSQTEPQPMPLHEHKILFYDFQMDHESVEVTQLDGSAIIGEQPTIARDPMVNGYVIDFTECTEGIYLISGIHEDNEVSYRVER